MWNFFVALFGGLYYGGKYLSEKSASKSADKAIKEQLKSYKEIFDEWVQKTTDEHLEGELRSLMERATPDEISEALSEIGWNGEMSPSKKRYNEDALRLMMASKGKLTYKDATYGIYSHLGKDPETRSEALMNVRSYNIVMFINDKLKSFGIDEPMYVYRVAYHPLHDKSSHVSGRYMWKPMLRGDTNIIEVSPRRRILCALDEPQSSSLLEALKSDQSSNK